MFVFMALNGYNKVLIRNTAGDIGKLKEQIERTIGLKSLFSFITIIIINLSSFIINYELRIQILIGIYSLTIFSNHISHLFQVVFHSNKKMQFLAFSNVLKKALYVFPAIAIVSISPNVNYLVYWLTFITIVSVFWDYYFVRKYFSITINYFKVFNIGFKGRYLKPAFTFSILSFISFLYSKIDIAMLSWFMSSKEVGLYSAGYKIIAPLEQFGSLAAVSFFPYIVEEFKKKKPVSKFLLFKASFALALLLIPVSAVLSYYSSVIVNLMFGEGFKEVSVLLKYLAWIIPLGIITWPFILAMQANNHEKKLIFPAILRSISNIVLNYFFIIKYGLIGVVYSTLITYFWYFVFINFGYQYFVLKKHNNIY